MTVWRRREDDVDEIGEELRTHLRMAVAERVARGETPADAELAARREFGNVTHVAEVTREIRGGVWLDRLKADVRFALRGYAGRPGFTAVVLLTLAIGIAATTATFTVVNAVLLRPLPYAHAERLVHVWQTQESALTSRLRASYPDYLDWRAETSLFEGLEGYDGTNVALRHGEHSEWARGARVTPGFFELLSVRPMLGTTFTAADDAGGGRPVVLLSYAIWTRIFAADRKVVGRYVTIDGTAHEIRGVLPREFTFDPAGDSEIWLPAGRSDEVRAQRFNFWLATVGRLREGVTVEMAQRRMGEVMRRLAREHPESNAGRTALVTPLRQDIVGDVERPLLVLLASVVIVLIIACANVASLILARSVERAREIAVRWALGASRGHVVRQLLTENLVLSVGGAILGAWLASLAVPLLLSALPPAVFSQAPALRDATVDVTALGFTSGIAVVVGVMIGLVPGLLVSRFSVADVLRSDTRAGAGRTSRRIRDGLVSAQIALTLVLLIGASLVGRSLVALLRVDPGFSAEGVATVRVALASTVEQWRPAQFFESALGQVLALPGVGEVGAISSAPLQGSGSNTFRVEGAPEPPPSRRLEAVTRSVAGDYFTALRIPLKEGRTVGARDNRTSPYAALINESLARRLFGTRSAVGERLRFYHWEDSAWTIVGVVGDVKTNSLEETARPTIYYSHLQGPANRMSIVARAKPGIEPASLIPTMRRTIERLDPTVAVYNARTMEQYVGGTEAVSRRRHMLVVLGTFAIAALLLAMMGVYGVIAYAVTQRAREIAIRMALGATRVKVVRLVMRHALRVAALGIAAGAFAALGLSRTLASLLFGVSAADLWSYALACAAIVLVAVAASYLPARSATRFDPVTALRSD
jgi:putative ABC transport system permease protein